MNKVTNDLNKKFTMTTNFQKSGSFIDSLGKTALRGAIKCNRKR